MVVVSDAWPLIGLWRSDTVLTYDNISHMSALPSKGAAHVRYLSG